MPYTLLPLPNTTKPLFSVKEDATLFGKGGVTSREAQLQRIAASLGVAPPVHSLQSHEGSQVLLMSRIQGSCLAELYDYGPIPPDLWTQIRTILQTLWNYGIEYKDVTPYNFMLEAETGRIWIVDFGHAKQVRMNSYLRKFLQGTCEWNPYFR